MRKEAPAKFTSRCSACGSDIQPGQLITYDPAVRNSSCHKVCPAVKQSPRPKVKEGTLLNGPVIAQPQVARLSDEAAAEILAKIGSTFVRPLLSAGPKFGIGYKVAIDGVEREIGRCNTYVGQVTDFQGKQSWVVSLIDGAILQHLTEAEYPNLKWMYAPLDKWTRELGAPLCREAGGKNSVQIGDIEQLKSGWYIVTAVDKPYYLSAQDAEDLDMFQRGGGWGTPYEIREITEPLAEREKREAQERADREQADAIVAAYQTARAQALALLPLGIRPMVGEEYHTMTEAIRSQAAQVVAQNYRSDEQLRPAVSKLVAAKIGNMADRLPAMPGNKDGYLGWEKIYRVGERLAVDYCDRSYDGSGWQLQGISVLPEDAQLLDDMSARRAIKGYRFDPALYAAMVKADAEGTLSEYGRGSYFGGTPSPCYDLPANQRACTKGAYGREHNHTAAEVRADLIRRFAGNDAVLSILAREDSVTEIREEVAQ